MSRLRDVCDGDLLCNIRHFVYVCADVVKHVVGHLSIPYISRALSLPAFPLLTHVFL